MGGETIVKFSWPCVVERAAVSHPEHSTFPGMNAVLGAKGGHGSAQILSPVCGYGLLSVVCSHSSSKVGWRVMSLLEQRECACKAGSPVTVSKHLLWCSREAQASQFLCHVAFLFSSYLC